MSPFFITGMPRSRTAWLANWLTTDRSLCVHDPVGSVVPVIGGKLVGVSGPEVCCAWDSFRAAWPDSPWLVVTRADAKYAFKRVLSEHMEIPDQFDTWWAGRLELLAQIVADGGARVLSVKFEDLDREETARTIWRHLLPELPFDRERWELLNDLTVTQDIWKRKARTWPLAR